jgi:hypothetical protein
MAIHNKRLLKFIKRKNIPDENILLLEVLERMEKAIQEEPYCDNDKQVAIHRYLIDELGGLTFKFYQIESNKDIIMEMLKSRRKEDPEITNKKLACETGLAERTITDYLREI